MKYKERFISLLNEIYNDNNAELIPMVIGEGIRESEAFKNSPDGKLDYWIVQNIYSQYTK